MFTFTPLETIVFSVIFFGAYIIPILYILLSVIFFSLSYYKKHKRLFWMTVVPSLLLTISLIMISVIDFTLALNIFIITTTLSSITYLIFLLFQWLIICCQNSVGLIKIVQYIFLSISTTLLVLSIIFTKAIFFQSLVIFLLISIIFLILLFFYVKYKNR